MARTRNAHAPEPTDDAPAHVTPRMLSAEFNLTPQRVRKILRRAKFMSDARVKNDAWRMNADDADAARALLTAYITRRDARNAPDTDA